MFYFFKNLSSYIRYIFVHFKYFSTSIKKSPGAATREEAVCDVGGEVYTESDGDDEGVAGDHVYGQVPEVHEPSNLEDGGGHAEDDYAGGAEAAEEDEDG